MISYHESQSNVEIQKVSIDSVVRAVQAFLKLYVHIYIYPGNICRLASNLSTLIVYVYRIYYIYIYMPCQRLDAALWLQLLFEVRRIPASNFKKSNRTGGGLPGVGQGIRP